MFRKVVNILTLAVGERISLECFFYIQCCEISMMTLICLTEGSVS